MIGREYSEEKIAFRPLIREERRIGRPDSWGGPFTKTAETLVRRALGRPTEAFTHTPKGAIYLLFLRRAPDQNLREDPCRNGLYSCVFGTSMIEKVAAATFSAPLGL
jgi:hypothetical protein